MSILSNLELGILYGKMIGALMFFLAFIYLYCNEKKDYLKYWAIFWGTSVLSYITESLMHYIQLSNLLLFGYILFSILGVFNLLRGMCEFSNKNMKNGWYIFSILTIILSLGAVITNNLLTSIVLSTVFTGIVFIYTGLILYRSLAKVIAKFTGIIAMIFGVMIMILPFVQYQTILFKYINIFNSSLGMLFGFGLIGIYYENLYKRKRLTQISVDKADFMVFRVNPEGNIKYINEKASQKLGLSEKQIKNLHVKDIIPKYIYRQREEFWKEVKSAGFLTYESKFKTQNEEIFPVQLTSHYSTYNNKDYEFVFARDISKRKQAEKRLKIREEQYRKIFNKSPAGMMLIDENGKILKVNEAECEFSGYKKSEIEGNYIYETVVPAEFKEKAKKNIKKILSGKTLEYIAESVSKTGEKIFLLLRETKIKLPDDRPCVLSMQIDYTDYNKQQEKIRYITYHDELTDLYNRSYVEEELKRLDTNRQLPISIIMIDVNGLKIINDTYGHERGDDMLVKVADILLSVVRKEDIVARWAGDEFVILLPQTNEEDAKNIRQRIKYKCDETEKDKIPVSLGVGVAVKINKDQDIYNIINKADENMYQDKLTESRSAKNKLVKNLLSTLGAKSDENEEHSKRMTKLARKLGTKIGLSDKQLANLSLLATLHDIGKVSISEEILSKSGELSEKEWEKIKEHPEMGYRIVSATEEFSPVAKEVLSHHENWDGSGYPNGLEGKDIPLLSRIITIVDAYDVMTNGKTYKESISKEEALKELDHYAGSQFDPELVKSFIDVIRNQDI